MMSSVSREAEDALTKYWALLLRWNAHINLIGRQTMKTGWQRHIEDSIQLSPLFPPRSIAHVDLGSGGGLPAIPIALVRRDVGFEDRVVMIESDSRKAAFLRSACRSVGLSVEIRTERAESGEPAFADVATARAVAPLGTLLGWVHRHLRSTGMALLPKGRRAEDELSMASEVWNFDLQRYPSLTDPDAAILRMRNIHRKA